MMPSEFRRRFWLPPRAHGEIVEDRSVSFLELFYDLVYVVVVAQAAHALAHNVSWRGVVDFTAIFGLIWLGWLNGTLYYDLHGREDGRTRTMVFAQMLLLAWLAVYTETAATDTGEEFALVYAIFFGLMTLLWYGVRRQDSDEYGRITAQYISGSMVFTVVMFGTIWIDADVRVWVWGGFVLLYIISGMVIIRSGERTSNIGFDTTDSLVERFGLFTIIVLGEVVVGVIDGLSSTDLTPLVVVTGMLGLMIGFAFWWSYFDFVGKRHPREAALHRTRWIFGHLPVTLAIAAAGAAMVSMVEHASDDHVPAGTAWLMSGAVAFGLVWLVMVMRTLQDYERVPELFNPTAGTLLAAASIVLFIGWWQPAPWLMLLTLWLLLSATWFTAAYRWMHLNDPEAALPS
jgi:low temperature requirement protein LtrA